MMADRTKGWNAVRRELVKHRFVTHAQLQNIIHSLLDVSVDYALWKLVNEGSLARTRRGFYGVTPRPTDHTQTKSSFINESLSAIVSLLSEEAVFGYGTALLLHGLSRYGMLSEQYLLCPKFRKPRSLGGVFVRFVITPVIEQEGLVWIPYNKIRLHATDPERTIVDCIHRPRYAQGWENIIHAFERAENLDASRMIRYVKRYRIPSLIARTGFMLEKYLTKKHTVIAELDTLGPYLPHSPVPFINNRGGRLNRRWNLFIPEEIEHA